MGNNDAVSSLDSTAVVAKRTAVVILGVLNEHSLIKNQFSSLFYHWSICAGLSRLTHTETSGHGQLIPVLLRCAVLATTTATAHEPCHQPTPPAALALAALFCWVQLRGCPGFPKDYNSAVISRCSHEETNSVTASLNVKTTKSNKLVPNRPREKRKQQKTL